jgi:hypothetical protein
MKRGVTMNRRLFIAMGSIGGGLLTFSRTFKLIAQSTNEPSAENFNTIRGWMKNYNGRSSSALLSNPWFSGFILSAFPQTPLPFWNHAGLLQLIGEYFSLPGPVAVAHNRYILAQGRVSGFGLCRAMLWVDTHRSTTVPIPPAALAVLEVHGRPANNFWLVSNTDFAGYSAVPHNLKLNIGRWVCEEKVKYQGFIGTADAVPNTTLPSGVLASIVGVPVNRFNSASGAQ